MEQPLYDILRGNWNINRVIDDRRAGQPGSFTGTATFAGRDCSLLYTEEGELRLGQTSLRALRSYHWSFEGDSVAVSYSDGSPFHDFTLAQGRAKAKHLCGDDIYCAAYSFYLPERWTVTWTVSGPRKDYTSQSEYTR